MAGDAHIKSNLFKKSEEDAGHHKEQLKEMVRERIFELLEANENLQLEIKVRKQMEEKLLGYQKKLQSLSSQISIIEEREKRKIASELHDRIGQALALVKIKLGILSKSSDPEAFKKITGELLLLIEQTIRETRTLTFELCPPILYELGLRQALQWLVDQFIEKHGIPIEFKKDDGETPLTTGVRFIIFQAVRELLVNVIKHAKATQIRLSLSTNNNGLKIIVEDNGTGFQASSPASSGYGLFNIRERINHINGRFEIKSTRNLGTRVTLAAPFEPLKDVSVERSRYE